MLVIRILSIFFSKKFNQKITEKSAIAEGGPLVRGERCQEQKRKSGLISGERGN